MADEVDKIIDDEIKRGDADYVSQDDDEKAREPAYRVMGDSKIPVSKSHGMLWKSRKDNVLFRRKNEEWESAWNEAIRYYRNDQTFHRYQDGSNDGDYDAAPASKMTRRFNETENIVFSNTSALVPSLYAKNPVFEITAVDRADERIAAVCENLVTRLFNKKHSPGINLKPKARKCVVMCTLTNSSYIEVGYTFREQSSEQAMQDLQDIAEKLEKAKDSREIEALEGQLIGLEERIDLLRPAGPWAKVRRPHDVLFDPDSTDEDRNDAKWCMIRDFVPTKWLNAVYGKPTQGDDGTQYESIYEPTHILNSGGGNAEGHNSAETEIVQYTLLSDEQKSGTHEYKNYGYDDKNTFDAAKRTEVWYVWDKVTQRVYLFSDKNWKWPVWVWDNPYNLQGFFPVYKLQFYTDPEEAEMRGEVSYYLDQQDAINTINSELKQARAWARRNVFYDKNRASKDEVEQLLKGDEDAAIGIDVPEGMTLKDFIMPMLPPAMQVMELFDKEPILAAVDRVSSVQPVMRGVEFKTNTTNQAINTYNSVQQTRLDEKIDAVEEFIGKIGWAVCQMCLQFMPAEQVAGLLGDAASVGWTNLDATRIDSTLQFTVIGGSTQNPTSEAKKQQAMNMGQVLGQFVQAAPVPVMTAMLSQMRSAFNDTIPDATWEQIIGQLEQQGQAPAAGGSEGGGAPSGGGEASPDGAAANQVVQQLDQLIQQLPPEAQQALGQAVSQGVPISAALERIIPAAQAAQGTA